MQKCIPNEEAMMALGENLARFLKGGDIIYLQGELGAGKTTLVRGILRGLGYSGRVTSPTFTLMNIYASQPTVYHFDFYRLQGQDLTDLGLEDYLGREGITLIEWPEIGQHELPEEALAIAIDLVDGDYERERIVRLKACGDRYKVLAEELGNVYSGH